MNKIYVDRSRSQSADRCRRLRWLEYHEGPERRGIAPARKSIHLVLGGAVHVGLEMLLKQSQIWLSDKQNFDEFFPLAVRSIEDEAVKDALADLAKSTKHGIELDEQEKPGAKDKPPTTSSTDTLNQQLRDSIALLDSPIEISFGDEPIQPFVNSPELPKKPEENPAITFDFGTPVYSETKSVQAETAASEPIDDDRLQQIEIANTQAATGMDQYFKEELAAQVEAIIRAYSRRRLRPLLEQFEVLEVEREGEWKLGEADTYPPVAPKRDCPHCEGLGFHKVPNMQTDWGKSQSQMCSCTKLEVWFMSRLDALLLERSTNLLYLQSYKTTGSWDRRKESDAQTDMQGLSEAVDVDNRLAEAWSLLRSVPIFLDGDDSPAAVDRNNKAAQKALDRKVEPRVAQWLATLPEPPRVLGVRYEYLLKGPRRADKKDPQQPGRYVTDTPLIRGWIQEGITGGDRRWGHSYDYYDLQGKGKRLDSRSWRKVPVWRHMSIANWIDRLDAGLVQPEAYDVNGHPVDILAEQFIQPIHVYRNEDDLRDLLEQLEAKEIRIAVDVAAVRAVEHDPVLKRSELNKRFPQTRSSCNFPGSCPMKPVCFGNTEMHHNPLASELYQVRQVNHPVELSGALDSSG